MNPLIEFDQFINSKLQQLQDDNYDLLLNLQGKVQENSLYIERKLSLCIYLKNMKRYIEQIQQGHYEFFDGFEQLSQYLIYENYRAASCVKLLLYIMQRNMASDYLKDKRTTKFEFTNIPYKELKVFFHISNSTKYDNIMIEVEKHAHLEMRHIDYWILSTAHHMIQKYYFDKKDSYNEEDIEKIENSFRSLNIEESICKAFETILRKNLQKRKEKQKVQLSDSLVCTRQEPSKKYLSDKEYKAILKRVRTYYDEYQGKIVAPMDDITVTYVASLLLQLGFSRSEINRYFQAVERDNTETYYNGIAEYNRLYRKLKYYEQYYKNQTELTRRLNDIASYMEEIFICTDETYCFWKDSIYQELEYMKQLIPYTFDYEYSKAEQQYQKKI